VAWLTCACSIRLAGGLLQRRCPFRQPYRSFGGGCGNRFFAKKGFPRISALFSPSVQAKRVSGGLLSALADPLETDPCGHGPSYPLGISTQEREGRLAGRPYLRVDVAASHLGVFCGGCGNGFFAKKGFPQSFATSVSLRGQRCIRLVLPLGHQFCLYQCYQGALPLRLRDRFWQGRNPEGSPEYLANRI
jgi:hypothetical protein